MIKIVADTLSCIKPEEARELGIGLLPQIIIFESESYRDDNEITTEEFLIKLKASVKLPKTAAPSPALYDPIYKEFAEGGNTIIVICPSKEVSGTYRSASVAAQDFPDADIRVIDTLSIGPALGTLVRLAVQWARMAWTPMQSLIGSWRKPSQCVYISMWRPLNICIKVVASVMPQHLLVDCCR